MARTITAIATTIKEAFTKDNYREATVEEKEAYEAEQKKPLMMDIT